MSMDIKPIGSYIYPDATGVFRNPLTADLIQPDWKPVVNAVINLYRNEFGDALHSVYLRGSVAKGTAIKNISDIDTMAVVDLPDRETLNKNHALRDNPLLEQIRADFPFVTNIEFGVYLLSETVTDPDFTILLKLFGLNIYGKDVLAQLPDLVPGQDVYLHACNITKELAQLLENPEISDRKMTWITKRILRSGMEISTETLQRHSRDLYYCAESWKEADPEVVDLADTCLELSINPHEDRETLRQALAYFEKRRSHVGDENHEAGEEK